MVEYFSSSDAAIVHIAYLPKDQYNIVKCFTSGIIGDKYLEQKGKTCDFETGLGSSDFWME